MKRMKIALGAALSVAFAMGSTARAETYNFSYFDAGMTVTASGTFTTSGPASITGADITAITGTVGSDAITGLLGGTVSGQTTSPGGAFYYDNKMFDGPALSINGVLFSVGGDVPNQEWNLWGNGGTSGSLYSWTSAGGYKVASSGTLSITAVPEPETYALMLAGLGVLALVARRRKQR